MRRRRVLVFVAGAAALLGTGCAQAAPATTTPMPSTTPVSTPAAAVRAAGWWGRAIAVPGLAALNKGRNGEVLSVSCAAPGSCAAGGYYGNHGNNPYDVTTGRAFVVSEVNGTWAAAQEVAGSLNTGGFGWVASVSCAPAGSCVAGGSYPKAGRHIFIEGFLT